MKVISVCGIGIFLMLAGCKTVEKSQIVTAFQNAGGGDVSQATPAGITSFLAQHEDLRKQLTPLCNTQRRKRPRIGPPRMRGKSARQMLRQTSSANHN
jgi:hypothetical protein